jgi:hypothetical protein
MSNKKSVRLMALFAGLLLLTPGTAAAEEPGRWAFSLGFYDFVGSYKALEVGVERRFRPFALGNLDLKPVVGFSATDEESFWVYAGLRHDIQLSSRWTLTPQFAFSLYENGKGKELGGVMEFRSGLELSRRLNCGAHLGLLFYHLSNSRIYKFNPGAESFLITWSPGR